MILLKPLVKPSEECALPKYAILWLEYPVILVGKDKKFGWNATKTCCVKCPETLVGIDAVVLLAVDAEDGSVPLVYKLMR